MKILWVMTELLHPIDKGGKIRTYNILRELKRKHHVTYVALDDGSASLEARQRAEEYCDELVSVGFEATRKYSPAFYLEVLRNLFSALPFFAEKWRSAAMEERIAERLSSGGFDVVVCDFVTPSLNLPDSVPCAAVLFQHNVEAMIWKRHAQVQRNPLKKLYLHLQWRKAERFEREACRRFDRVIAVSEEDAEVMRRDYGIDEVEAVPTGVDTEFFQPSGAQPAQGFELVFTGSMDWLPNHDAITWFAEQILPRVRSEVPDVTLTVVGRNPYPALQELARRDPAIRVTGRVEDVRPYLERAAVYVIPLRIGGGTRLKAFEAMAMEKPIVSTALGVEGLPVRDGEELVVADDAEGFSRAVVALLRDPEHARRLGQTAAARVRRDFGWDGVAERFAEICERAAGAASVSS